MRGTPTRLPNCPQASRPIELPPSRRSLVSWSLSNDSATAQRAPPGHSAGRNLRPARTRLTRLRHSSSGHCQGSRSGFFVFTPYSPRPRSGRRSGVKKGNWSERRDSNSRPSAPHADALPGCATLRPGGSCRYQDHNRRRPAAQPADPRQIFWHAGAWFLLNSGRLLPTVSRRLLVSMPSCAAAQPDLALAAAGSAAGCSPASAKPLLIWSFSAWLARNTSTRRGLIGTS